MSKFDSEALNQLLKQTKKQLRGGLLATNIWDRETEEEYAQLNDQRTAVRMFNALTDSIDSVLQNSQFPQLRNYYILELEQSHLAVIVRHGDDVLQGLLLDIKECNIGVLLSLTIPNLRKAVKAARLS